MFTLSSETQDFIKKEMARYETKRSAVIPCLYKVQEDNKGWVSPDSVSALAKFMEIPDSWIREVLDFYTMFNKKPVGKYHVQVCGNISCAMAGGIKICKNLQNSFGVKDGEISSDGKVTVTRVECLGACDGAPMMQINDKDYLNITAESAKKIIEDLEG